MKGVGGSQPFHRDHAATMGLSRQIDAGIEQLPVYQHRVATRLPGFIGILYAVVAVLTQQVEQEGARLNFKLLVLAVNFKFDSQSDLRKIR